MFNLLRISDLVQVKPEFSGLDLRKAISRELNNKYSNKIVPGLGMGVTVWDLISIDDGLLQPGDGSIYYKTEFRLIIFRPFIGEVIVGWVALGTEDGIRVKTDFFDNIWIPKDLLFEGSFWKPTEEIWVWRTDEEDPEADVPFYVNEKIRIRIEKEVFNDIKPKGPSALAFIGNEEKEEKEEMEETPAYILHASCNSDGMGGLDWW